jgi:hypothetical protein
LWYFRVDGIFVKLSPSAVVYKGARFVSYIPVV